MCCRLRIWLDLLRRRVTRAGKRIDLTAKEFALLELLLRRQGEVLPRFLIASQVWGMNFDSDANVIEVAMRRLRAKIDDDFESKLIRTLRAWDMCSRTRSDNAAAIDNVPPHTVFFDGIHCRIAGGGRAGRKSGRVPFRGAGSGGSQREAGTGAPCSGKGKRSSRSFGGVTKSCRRAGRASRSYRSQSWGRITAFCSSHQRQVSPRGCSKASHMSIRLGTPGLLSGKNTARNTGASRRLPLPEFLDSLPSR